MSKQCRHFFITGRVQGVWFRATTQGIARDMDLAGWVKNVADGRVEVIACGETIALDTLEEWLHQGPKMARVKTVSVENIDTQKHEKFITR